MHLTAAHKTVQAVGHRIAVRIWDPIAGTKGGIVIPETAQERPQVGKVLSVGPQVHCGVKVGDTVVMASYAGADVALNSATVTVVSEDDILMVLTDEPVTPIVDQLLETVTP
jgi:chaperonin GroES